MKKRVKVIITLIAITLLLPIKAAAVTLGEYEAAVEKYTKELREKEAKIAKGKEEIAAVKKTIAETEDKIAQAEEEIEKLQAEIEKCDKEIKKKDAESKKIIEYYQIENGNNAYLEYIFGATSITDMVYRMSVAEQLTDYNDKVMKELKALIETNKKKKAELKKKQEELGELKKKLESEKERIEEEVSGVEGTVPSTKGQIELYQKRVNYYRSRGCSSNDIIGVTCDVPPKVTPSSGGGNVTPGAIIGENGFRFPVNGGRISWGYGGGHKGIDITRGCGTPIYAVAPGRVYYVGNGLDNYGAYMVLIVHNVNGQLVFSQYAHVQPGIPVYVGQSVDTNTVVAYMGSTGYSTGCHLHLEMSRNYGWAYNGTYYQYVNNITSPWNFVPSPY
ncbi:MAG: peptidoglycan DD-metalloendopeptidase family protein [Bacilli bacterium]|nr:peptidoglycan DD-metalloendopeptidase family protein [Bacilli bacterium]